MNTRRARWILVGVVVLLLLVLARWRAHEPEPGASTASTAHASPSHARASKTRPLSARGSTHNARLGSLSGVLLHVGSRRPAAGVDVCVLDSLGDVRACSPTGNDGAFTFTLPWGRYRVHIRDDALTAIGCDPSLDADIILTPAHPNVRRMLSVIAATASISGTVRDRLGGTVDGAVIRPQSLGGWSGLVALGLCAAALSDHSGRFTLAVPPGVFALHARADGYGAGVTGDVAPGQDVDIVLVPEGTIFGLVVDAASGEGIAGATVRAVRRATAGQPPIASATESDKYGAFTLTALTSGVYELEAFGANVHGAAPTSVELSAGARVEVRIPARAAFRLRAGLAMDDGTPCSLGIIELRHEHLEIERTANVGDDGEAVVDGLPRGPYEARALCPEGTLAIGPEHLQIEEDAAAQWTFAIGGAVVGEVTRAGNPAPSVTVTALPDGAAPVVTITDVDGRFRLSGLSTRTYSLWAGQGDDESEAIEVEVIAGREPRVALQLGDASVVEGIAQDAEGRPCAGAAVLLTRGPRRQRVNADARGWFSFGAQAPGEAEVALLDQDEQAFDRQELALRGDALPSLKLRCSPRDASLRGVIQDHEGDPVRDALVEATPLVAGEPDFAATSASTLSDAEGSFVIAGLATGSYRVTGRTIAGVEIASTSAATGEPVVLIAGPRASVAGSVRGEVAGPVLITLRRPSDGSTRTARVSASGELWRFDDVTLGEYTLEAIAANGARATMTVAIDEAGRSGLELSLIGEGP